MLSASTGAFSRASNSPAYLATRNQRAEIRSPQLLVLEAFRPFRTVAITIPQRNLRHPAYLTPARRS